MAAGIAHSQASYGLMSVEMDAENCPPPYSGTSKASGVVGAGLHRLLLSRCPLVGSCHPLTLPPALTSHRTRSTSTLTLWGPGLAATRWVEVPTWRPVSKSNCSTTLTQPSFTDAGSFNVFRSGGEALPTAGWREQR